MVSSEFSHATNRARYVTYNSALQNSRESGWFHRNFDITQYTRFEAERLSSTISFGKNSHDIQLFEHYYLHYRFIGNNYLWKARRGWNSAKSNCFWGFLQKMGQSWLVGFHHLLAEF